MPGPTPSTLNPDEQEQLETLRSSVVHFSALLDELPGDRRSVEHSLQFNQLRLDAAALLKGSLAAEVPPAITGDVGTDRSLSAIAILGVILALIGLGVNSIILEDVVINSLGCCVSSGGMLLVVAAFGVLASKHYRQRISTVDDLHEHSALLLHQLNHRLGMGQVRRPAEAASPPARPAARPEEEATPPAPESSPPPARPEAAAPPPRPEAGPPRVRPEAGPPEAD